MERVKVLRIIARLNIGGPAIHTILLTEKLNRNLFDSVLVAGSEDEQEGNMLDLMGERKISSLILPELGREISFWHDLLTFFKVYRIIRKFKPQIVHSHTAKAGTIGRLAAKLAGVPIVIHTFHGHVFHSYFSRLKTNFFLLIERFCGRFTDRVITISQRQFDDIRGFKVIREDRIVVVSLGLDLEGFVKFSHRNGEVRRELGVSDNCKLVGIVGRLVPIKNHNLFFDAARRITEKLTDVRFVVVGDGELRDELRGFIQKLGIEDKVSFLGWRNDLAKIYSDLDVLVLTSLNEGTPVAVIEAMASEVPVVATRVGGVPDLVDDGVTGYLVESGDKVGLVEAITKVLNNPEEAHMMGEAGRRKVYPDYDISNLVQHLEGLYKELLREKGLI